MFVSHCLSFFLTYSYKNFTLGKPIKNEKARLAQLNENMKFKGGPSDIKYKKKV